MTLTDQSLSLFAAYGIELEYMIVDNVHYNVLPVTDKVLFEVAQAYEPEVEMGEIAWSNELALHVIELKTNGPATDLSRLSNLFHEHVSRINAILAKLNGCLMPTAMHPWIQPDREMQLWTHAYSPVYEAYNRIFDCRGHGWANLQSMHINLPFANDEEFGKLHAAIRLVLPLLPALAASSPIAERKRQDYLDYRLQVYRFNQAKVPAIAGQIVPEQVFTKADYESRIFEPMYQAIAPHDPDGLLRNEWLNSRGAIARFGRNAIEIRLIDLQECPQADLAIAGLVVATLQALLHEKWGSLAEQQALHESDLLAILNSTITHAENAVITNQVFLHAFGLNQATATAAQVWQHIVGQLKAQIQHSFWHDTIQTILSEGTLASRILKAWGNDCDADKLKTIYATLSQCLANNQMFIPHV